MYEMEEKFEQTPEKFVRQVKKKDYKASEKHRQLANFIKEIHTNLRMESEKHGVDKAWKIHVQQNEKLQIYAKSMYELATKHWKQQSSSSVPFTFCRVEWIKNQCQEYFFRGGIQKFDDKEKYLMTKDIQESNENIDFHNIKTIIGSKINMLDVGSCYNPFNMDDTFSVTAVDIAPYSSDVVKCDFLNLKVENTRKFSEDQKILIELPKNSYDTVVFSLLLEYIPCPEQRFLCCKKAYDLLKNGGILFIATPDSKHEGANTKIINTSWKVVLAKLGFMRIHYEKLPHIHCLVFRKCFYKETALKRVNWKKIPKDKELFSSLKIFIPQDFHRTKSVEDNLRKKTFDHNDQELITLFNELPCDNFE